MKYCDFCTTTPGIRRSLIEATSEPIDSFEAISLKVDIENATINAECNILIGQLYGFALYQNIKFCPMCGRELTKSQEKLNDENSENR